MGEGSPISASRLLTAAEFRARIPNAYRDDDGDLGLGLRQRFETDYALTRLVAANCAAVAPYERTSTPFVIKGGFAIRHLYASPRFSKDADLSMISDELEIAGIPDDLVMPHGMEIVQRVVGDVAESFKVFIEYSTTERQRKRIQCDLNSRERPIRLRPPQRRPLTSLFVDPFPVWAATLAEIVGEKFLALIDLRAARIKDVFDLHHVLSQPTLQLDTAATRKVYEALRARKRKGPPASGLPTEIEEIARSYNAEAFWQDAVGDLLPAPPSLRETTDELIELVRSRVLAGA